jgi:hypothetical protein
LYGKVEFIRLERLLGRPRDSSLDKD